MKQINLLPSAEEVKLTQGAEAELAKRRKKRVAGGVAAWVRAMVQVGKTQFSLRA